MQVKQDGYKGLPRSVWALGLTSLLMDTSSELIHGLLPVFLVVTLGASATALGVIEGIAEATAQITRVFSGWLSDALGRRKALTVAGYGLAAVTKPLFPLANTIGLVLLARFLDRIGKGIRGAPRDALVADLTPTDKRGAAFGLRQSLDTVGATADLVLAAGASLPAIFIGIGLWGLHMGLTQGVLAALIAATARERLRGTAFGLFGLITGLAALVASVLAGLLWDRIGAGATFLAGAAFAATALIAFFLVKQDPGAAGK